MADSPAKKLNFDTVDKENLPFDAEAPVVTDVAVTKSSTRTLFTQSEVDDMIKEALRRQALEEVKVDQKAVAIASTIKPQEQDEPLLQENPNRFVMFPIKYHEVSSRVIVALRVKCFRQLTSLIDLADVQKG